jgi:hypothetical protein
MTWGFVLVRCTTYASDDRWTLFLLTLKEQNDLSDKLAQSQRWTTIEDKDLDNATMANASLTFRKWADGECAYAEYQPVAPRHQYFIYVNAESIESILNPDRAVEKSGNFLVLVNAGRYLESCKETEACWRDDINVEEDIRDVMADTEDNTWKLIPATSFQRVYVIFLVDPDPWHQYSSEFQSAPYVYHRFDWHMVMSDFILYPDKLGYDVYLMLKQIYGKTHSRSVCFETDEAQTGLQRICGYAGGYRKEEFTYPWYL